VQDAQSETIGLSDGWKWWLVANATDVGISEKVVHPGFLAGTIGPLHQSAVYPPC